MNFEGEDTRITSSTSGILRVVVPLILSSLSSNLMFLVDRFILAYYSIDSMNAAMLGGSVAGIYTLALMSIAGTTEIFVGQCNGARMYDKIASSVWQMFYFVLIAVLFALLVGYFSEYLNWIPVYYAKEGIIYQKILTYFCWLPALVAAFTGFFVGRGRTKIITVTVLSGVILNTIFDYLLIFGFWKIPSLGCSGAAIATVLAEFVQVIILASVFWSTKNRKFYKTFSNNKFDKKLFFQCIKVGYPMALGQCIEMFAWYLVVAAVSHVSKDMAAVQGISTTMYVVFAFICEGLTKGSAAVSTNFIGQQNLSAVKKSQTKLQLFAVILCSCVMLPMVLHPNIILAILGSLKEDLSRLYPTIVVLVRIIFAIIVFESLYSVRYGALLSGGDTKYPNIMNLACLFLIVVFPVLFMFHFGRLRSVIVVQTLSACWLGVRLILINLRFRQMKWYKFLIR